MIIIIKAGTKREVTCNKCGAVLSYDSSEDVQTENIERWDNTGERVWFKKPQNYIICPQCEYKIVLEITR